VSAQAPQPLANPVADRYPVAPPSGYLDQAVGIGLYEEQGDGIGNDPGPNQLVTRKVYALGTVRDSTGTYISIARYNPDGSGPDVVAFWPPYCPTCDPYTPCVRAAKAITVPVVPWGANPGKQKLFALVTTDGPTKLVNGQIVPTSNITVLCYSLNLGVAPLYQPEWTYTYNFEPGGGFEGDDVPIAICTDQSNDIVTPGNNLDYNFVAVLGSSEEVTGEHSAVTIALCKTGGQVLGSPYREKRMRQPVSIAAENPFSILNCSTSRVFITGNTSESSFSGQIITEAYYVPDAMGCPGTTGTTYLKDEIPSWPRYFSGNLASAWTTPARIKCFKNTVVVTGTNTNFEVFPQRSDFVTLAYAACDCDCAQGCCNPIWHDQWSVPASQSDPTPRYAKAADMDVVLGLDGEFYAVVTGSATNLQDGTTGVASMMYDASGGRQWTNGALWNRDPVNPGDDEGVAIRCIRATDNSLVGFFNAYIVAKSATATGWDYATIKYDGGSWPSTTFKPPGWTSNIPFYNGPGNANDVPVGIAVEYRPLLQNSGDSRGIWITGTSNGGASADDWATQFIIEQIP
jgi:hypothetical protein